MGAFHSPRGMTVIWQYITDLGDSSVTVSLAGFILLYLLARGRWRQALAWTLAVVACAIGTGLVKVMFLSCMLVTAVANISGHTALSTTVYGGFALLSWGRPVRWPGFAVSIGAGALVIAIALSRIVLHAHQWYEVAAGLGVGLATILLFIGLSGPRERIAPTVGLLAGMALLVALLHGFHWPAEKYISDLSARMIKDKAVCKPL